MPPSLEMRLLGDFSLTCDGMLVEGINTSRLQSLIAYLVLHRDAPQLRQHLAFVFWPDSSETQARNNLRQLIHVLRHTLPSESDFLAIDTRTLQWRRDAPLRLDADEFTRALTIIEQAEQQSDSSALLAAGERMLEMYQTDLLPGCYDEWITPERERLRERFVQALGRLVVFHEAQRNFAVAIPYARRMIRAAPLHEEAYRSLMRLLALTGDRAGELQVFQACATALQRELGIGPSQATKDLHERLQHLEALPVADNPPVAALSSAHHQPMAGPPSLVGRAREWETLRQAWQAASTSSPSFVLITGEAGIGKSRLAEEMAHWASQQGATVATTRSYAVEGRLSFAPVIEWLRSAALRPHLGHLETVWLTEVTRILPELLTEYPGLPHYEPMSEYGQRQRFFQALALAVLAAPQPLLLAMDDLQWCDQDTLEWLHFLLRFDTDARLLILGTARTDEVSPQHPLRTLLHHLRHTIAVTEIALHPLDAAETAALAASMIERELDTASAMRLFGETEGNPLFVIEAVRAGLDELLKQPIISRGAVFPQALPSHTLPAGVRTVIAGRLAQLSASARELAALAAVVGREFSLDILTHASHTDEESIVRALDELWERGIVREQGNATYDFSHDKLREIAYAEINAPQRHLWHRRLARALETLYGDNLDPVSGQIAAHYEHGGSIEQTIPYYRRAALVAQRLFAHDDAILLLRHCLTLLEQIPSSATRDKQELDILLALEALYRITRGWTGPELEQVVDRSLVLCDRVGDDMQRAKTLYGLQSLLIVQAKLDRVQLVAEELHALYERTQNAAPPLLDMMLTGARLHLGRLSEANDSFTRILTTHDARQVLNFQESQGWNFAVHTRGWQSHALWCLGYPERALRSALDAVQLAHELEQLFNGALAATFLAMLSQMSADVATAQKHAEEALALTIEYKSPYYGAWSAILASHAHARAQPDEGHIVALRAAIEVFISTGVRLRLPYFLSLLADIYGLAGRPEEGLQVLEDALTESRNSNERWWDTELHRMRGELTLAAGRDVHGAETALQRAVDVARSQQSRMLELRALLSLARLRKAEQRGEETCQALRDLYSSFSEGFDTPDLRAALAFLATSE